MIRRGGITDDSTLAAYALFLLAGEAAGRPVRGPGAARNDETPGSGAHGGAA